MCTHENNPIQIKGIVDVTNFNAMSPNDPLGYMCSCVITIFENGQLEICSDDGEKNILESFSVFNIVRMNNYINSYDPRHTAVVSLTTESKDLTITFPTEESKNEFWSALTTTYDTIKACK